MYSLLFRMSNVLCRVFTNDKRSRVDETGSLLMIRTIGQADPEGREVGRAQRRLSWHMRRKSRFSPFQPPLSARPIQRRMPLFRLHGRHALPFETIRFSFYSPPHSAGPLRFSASSNVDR